MDDQYYMKHAIHLAKMVQGQTSPNPPVGAVIVKNGAIVGLGAHLKAGDSHAEIHALNMAGDKANRATIYITLEPCSHQGKTPPCIDAIIKKRLKRVVIAMLDPNEKNNTNSIERLEQSGITVDVGVMQKEAMLLNKQFCHFIKKKRPFVTVKAAVTLDGKIAASSGDSKWITSTEAREDVHRYRTRSDAILVGVNTVLHDDPKLTARLNTGCKNPLRVVLDTHLRTPVQSQLITDRKAETWIFTGNNVAQERKVAFRQYTHVTLIQLPNKDIQLEHVLDRLGEKEIMTLFVEGGSEINASFLEKKLADEFIFYIAPKLIGGKQAYTSFGGTGFQEMKDAWDLEFKEVNPIGRDIKIIAVPRKGGKHVYRNN